MISPQSLSLSTWAILACCLATVSAHAITLNLSADDWLATPVAGLSQARWAPVQSLGLLLFALAHLILALSVSKTVFGRQHRLMQVLLLIVAAFLAEATFAFIAQGASLSGMGANNWRLIVIACLVGLIMALIWYRAAQVNPVLWRFNLVCTVVWMAMAPVGALVSDGWVGGYERLIAMIYVIWIAGITLLRHPGSPAELTPGSEHE